MDFSNSSLPTNTSTNDFLQLVCNKLFPKTYYSYKDGEEFDVYSKVSGSGSLTKETNRLKIYTSLSTNGTYTLVESGLVDFTDYEKLCIEFTSTKYSNNYVSFGYGTAATASYSNDLNVTDGESVCYSYSDNQPSIQEFNISSIKGKRKIFLLGLTGNHADSTVYITNIYLE